MTTSRTQRLKARNEKITVRFLTLKDKKINGVQLYTQDAIFTMLSGEFHLSERTIENIVFGRVNYKDESE